MVSQIKNIKQVDEKTENKDVEKLNSLTDLIQICKDKKELNLKYELENNVNLVSFSKYRIEISFNEKLDKNFVKKLSEKLFDWTNRRWIITFSKEKGAMSAKERKKSLLDDDIKNFKKTKEYSDLLELVPDVELIDIKKK